MVELRNSHRILIASHCLLNDSAYDITLLMTLHAKACFIRIIGMLGLLLS